MVPHFPVHPASLSDLMTVALLDSPMPCGMYGIIMKSRFKDDSRKEYWYNGKWVPTDFRYEHIILKDSTEYIDTVAYTVFGPVMYDKSFSGSRKTNNKYYAVRWKAP